MTIIYLFQFVHFGELALCKHQCGKEKERKSGQWATNNQNRKKRKYISLWLVCVCYRCDIFRWDLLFIQCVESHLALWWWFTHSWCVWFTVISLCSSFSLSIFVFVIVVGVVADAGFVFLLLQKWDRLLSFNHLIISRISL